jgi:hypothetical protein
VRVAVNPAAAFPVTAAAPRGARTFPWPGTYVLYCLIPDAASGPPHIQLGMFRAIEVE